MAAPENIPHLKQVLHSYKSQAMNNLQGPGSQQLFLEPRLKTQTTEMCHSYNFKKAILYGGVVKQHFDNKSHKEESKWHLAESNAVNKITSQSNELDNICRKNIDLPLQVNKSPETLIVDLKNKNQIELDTDVNGETVKSLVTLNISESKPDCNWKETDKRAEWVEPGNFMAPAPFPPLPWPILGSADPGQLPSQDKSEIFLDGELISCFVIGGEPRLCLPQILNTVFRTISLTQINAVCDDLCIYCSRCTRSQLNYLKDCGILPVTATSCGLIRRTDAQRLTHALLYSHPPRFIYSNSTKDDSSPPRVIVSHNSFGKCKGILFDEFYNNPLEPCIQCQDCQCLFSPQQFVCHAHTMVVNNTIHWGFDWQNWRAYTRLSREQNQPLQKAETELSAFKSKFEYLNSKRKQTGDVKDDVVKRPRNDTIVVNLPAAYHTIQSYGWVDGTGGLCRDAPYTLIPILSKDSSVAIPVNKETEESSEVKYKISTPEYGNGVNSIIDWKRDEGLQQIRQSPAKQRHKYLKKGDATFRKRESTHLCQSPSQDKKNEQNSLLSQKSVKLELLADEEIMKTKSFTDRQTKHGIKIELHDRTATVDSNLNIIVSPKSYALRTSNDGSKEKSYERVTMTPTLDNLPPDLELSTTDSDTESVNSVCSKSEVVEEAEALLRGWNDRAAAKKVLGLVSSLAKMSLKSEKKLREILNEKELLQEAIAAYDRRREVKQICDDAIILNHAQNRGRIKLENT